MSQHKINKSNVYIGLSNPKSPDNVNSVKRAAGNFSVAAIFYTGTRYPRAVRLNPKPVNMSRDVSLNLPITGVTDFMDELSDDMKLVCVELVEGATSLPAYQHPEYAFYVFGPEDGSINQELINKADAVIYVPTQGCMNLAATVNVVLYDRLSKLPFSYGGNELIFKNRDTNNNLVLKNKKISQS